MGMTQLELVGSHRHLEINRNLENIAIYTKYRHLTLNIISTSLRGTCFQNKPRQSCELTAPVGNSFPESPSSRHML